MKIDIGMKGVCHIEPFLLVSLIFYIYVGLIIQNINTISISNSFCCYFFLLFKMSKGRILYDRDTETKKKNRELEMVDCEAGPSTSFQKDGKPCLIQPKRKQENNKEIQTSIKLEGFTRLAMYNILHDQLKYKAHNYDVIKEEKSWKL